MGESCIYTSPDPGIGDDEVSNDKTVITVPTRKTRDVSRVAKKTDPPTTVAKLRRRPGRKGAR